MTSVPLCYNCNTNEVQSPFTFRDGTGGQTAEIAAWDKDGNWHSFGHDQVKGWCSPEEVASFLQMVSSF